MSTPKKIICIDIEATCWEHLPPNQFPAVRNEIIEIGLAVVDIKTKQLEKSRSLIVLPPTTEISPFCTSLTTLTEEFVLTHGIDFSKAMNILRQEYRVDRNMWASWGEYDKRSFEKNCQWNNVGYPFANTHLNVKSLFAAIHGYNGGLAKCAADIGIPFEGTQHRGVDDAWIVAKTLIKLLEK